MFIEFDIEQELKKLPASPGVYLMHSATDEIIYVGKAKSLKNRVRQYFQASYKKSNKIKQMVSLVDRFEYIVTDSELEALILESNLIKEYKPRYNTLLKDDKNYPYIKITATEEFPRILTTRYMKKDGAKYFGPYPSVQAVHEVVELMQKMYHIRSCQIVIRESNAAERGCLNLHIDRCDGPCIGKISKEDYREKVKQAVDFLNGNYEGVIRTLSDQMSDASERLDFEKAIEYRNLIQSINKIADQQKVTVYDGNDRDVIGMARWGRSAMLQVFFLREGKVVGREHSLLEIDEEDEDEEIIESFLKQFYNGTPYIPSEIWIQLRLESGDMISQWLSSVKGKKVRVVSPQKGKKEKLVELAVTNAKMLLEKTSDRQHKEDAKIRQAMRQLNEMLNAEKKIRRMESYDISNISGVFSVGAMVVYEDGKPKRNDYRKFRITGVDGPNDYASMQEMLERRFEHGLSEISENKRKGKDNRMGSFSILPDLILMDGGKGQMRIAQEVLEKAGLTIPVCGMVKDDRHRTRALLYQNQELEIDTHSELFRLITRIQDETHRFAIEYHRSLRGQNQIHSVLDDIPGIGTVRRKALLRRFKEIERIRTASVEELAETESMDLNAAKNVYAFFRNRTSDSR